MYWMESFIIGMLTINLIYANGFHLQHRRYEILEVSQLGMQEEIDRLDDMGPASDELPGGSC